MKRIVFVIVLSGIFVEFSAQQEKCDCQSGDDYVKSLRRGLIGREYVNPVKEYDGVQYFGPWTKGEVLLISGEKISGIDLRYERYLDELLWLREKDFKAGVLQKNAVAGFNLFLQDKSTASFVRRKIKLPADTDSTYRYLQLLEQGEIDLYAYRKVIESPNGFILYDDSKYLAFTGNQYEMITLNRKDIISMPMIDRNRMKAIIRSNKIRIKNNEAGMVKALNLHNHPD